jgi:myo-inositol-1(or 4)-monophosphatase
VTPSQADLRDPGQDLERTRRIVIEAAEAAGELLRAGRSGDLRARSKGAGDVVTKLDFQSEALILDRLRAHFPDTHFSAEESGQTGTAGGDNAWTWVIDPLDGTNNIAIGLSTYVVGIALCQHQRPVLGVVHEPVDGRTWSAVRGSGLRGPNGVPPSPACPPDNRGLVVAWTQGHEVRRDDVAARSLKMVLEANVDRVFAPWAPLLSWAMLARGDLDGVVGYRPEEEDLCAGYLLAVEAGLTVRALDGGEFDDRIGLTAGERGFVAAGAANIDRLVTMVKAAAAFEPDLRDLRVPSLG